MAARVLATPPGLAGADLHDRVVPGIGEVVADYVAKASSEGFAEEWDLDQLWAAFRRRNAALWSVTAASAAILALVVAIPPVREVFHFGPLHPDDIAVALGCGVAILLLLEGFKRRLGAPGSHPA